MSIILITGSTGTVGKEVVRSLAQKIEDENLTTNTTIRLLVRDIVKTKELFSDLSSRVDIQYFKGDVTSDVHQSSDISEITRAFSGIHRLFLSFPATPTQLEHSLVKLAVQHSSSTLKQVIKLSGLGADLNHDLNSVFRWHGEAERDLYHYLKDKQHIAYIILRPNLFLQNFLRDDMKTIKEHNVFYRPGTTDDYRISHVDVRDIADATAVLLTEDPLKHAGRTFNLTGPQSLPYHEVANIISNSLGRRVDVAQLGDYDYFNMLLLDCLMHSHGYLSNCSNTTRPMAQLPSYMEITRF